MVPNRQDLIHVHISEGGVSTYRWWASHSDYVREHRAETEVKPRYSPNAEDSRRDAWDRGQTGQRGQREGHLLDVAIRTCIFTLCTVFTCAHFRSDALCWSNSGVAFELCDWFMLCDLTPCVTEWVLQEPPSYFIRAHRFDPVKSLWSGCDLSLIPFRACLNRDSRFQPDLSSRLRGTQFLVPCPPMYNLPPSSRPRLRYFLSLPPANPAHLFSHSFFCA